MGEQGTVDYDFMVSKMKHAAEDMGLVWPASGVYVRIVNLISFYTDNPLRHLTHNEQERSQLDQERAFFAENPHLGELHFWQTLGVSSGLGATGGPMYTPAYVNGSYLNITETGLRQFLAINLDDWQPDRLPSRVSRLFEMVHGATVPPTKGAHQHQEQQHHPGPMAEAVVVHCVSGSDRTGEMIGSYQLRHQKMSYQDVLDIAFKSAGRFIGPDQQTALQWYCYHLKEAYGEEFGHLDCSTPAHCLGKCPPLDRSGSVLV